MRAAVSSPSRYSVVFVTTDELVCPEIDTYLVPGYDVVILGVWDKLVALVKKQPPDAIFLDLDTIGERSQDGITALTELRSLGPDMVLIGLTRSSSRLRQRWMNILSLPSTSARCSLSSPALWKNARWSWNADASPARPASNRFAS